MTQAAHGGGDYDFKIKIIIIGDPNVGKSCFLLRYCNNEYASTMPTLGIDFQQKLVDVGGTRLCLQIWDTAGQDRYQSICKAFYRGADGIFMGYAVNDRRSFANVMHWGAQIHEHAQPNIVRVVLANKSDVPDAEREVTREEGEELAKRIGSVIVETSARSGEGVEQAFRIMAKSCLNLKEAEEDGADVGMTDVKNAPEKQTKRGCC